jgi:DNA-binding beta-propeller fold protein YncE
MKNYVKTVSLVLGLASLSFAQTTTAPIYSMSIVAGIPSGNSLGDGGPSVNGIVASPQGIAVDPSGNIYISDNTNSRIRRIDATTGIITTLSNSSTSGPAGMAFDPTGKLWVTNPGSHYVTRYTLDGKTSTQMTHNGATNTFGGDNNYAIDAYFNGTAGVAVDAAGNVYLADTSNNRVRMIKNVNNCINTAVTINGVSKPHGCTVVTIAGGTGVNPQGPQSITQTLPNGQTLTTTSAANYCGATNTCQPNGTNTVGDGGSALLAIVNGPYGIAVTPDGSKVYVAQNSNHRIRVIDMNTGLISTLIGNCTAGSNPVVVPCPSGSFGSSTSSSNGISTLGDGKLATLGTTNSPRGLFLDSANNILYFADQSNNRIRAINLGTGIVATVVGGGSTAGDQGTTLNSGLLTSASLNSPYAVWVQNGLIYWVEQGANKVRVADPVAQTIKTLVNTVKSSGSGGPATQAYLGFATTFASTASPRVAVDPAGNLYIVEASLHKIRKVGSDGTINDWAGTGVAGSQGDTGPAAAARLSSPQQLAFDAAGNGYIADTGNNKIRKVDTTGVITTVVGRSQVTSCNSTVVAAGQCFIDKSNYVGDGGTPANAVLSSPQGVTVDSLGNLIIADTGHHAIRYADMTNNVINTIAGGTPAGTPDGPTDGRSGLGNSGLFDSTNGLYGLLNNPRGVAVDNAGNIYVADYTNAAVRELIPYNQGKYSLFTFYGSGSSSGTAPGIPTGTGTATVPARIRMSSNNATSIATDTGGNIYIAEAGDSRLVVVSADHSKVYQIAGGGSNDTGLNYTSGNSFNLQVPAVSGVAVDANGVVYTADRTGVVRKLVCTANCLPLK